MPKTKTEDEGTIKQGTIAGFMRKRTQLVGFEFGYWKHVQYCSEFLDNALDAIESFQWREIQKANSKIAFSMDQELEIENLTFIQEDSDSENSVPMDNESKHTLMQEFGLEPPEFIETVFNDSEGDEESGEIIDQDKIEVEAEVQRILDDMEEIIQPVENLVDIEPIVIIRLREAEAPSFLTAELGKKNVMNFTFEIFDNGMGMAKVDLRKFGKYLASSKSMQLKQTRGSQGFGSPSAFSDAQNTTGRPIVAVSKAPDQIYATVSEFFTTSKNEKKYLVHPSEVDSPFIHGTYVKLNYLNVKYVRGYVETYIKETAFLNPHVTIIFIDPFGKEKIYQRLVSSFPRQPKYAKPHPSSTNIGDLQDLLAKSQNLTISSFLQENFVRISSKLAKKTLDLASKDLQDKLNLFVLKNGFVNKAEKKGDEINFLCYEKRVFGKSTKPRDKLIIYNVQSEEIKDKYWESMTKYNQFNKEQNRNEKSIKKNNNLIEKSETRKEIKGIEKEIKDLIKKSDDIRKEKEKVKDELNDIFKNNKEILVEAKKLKNRSDLEELVSSIQFTKVKPTELTNDQFNSLFLAFKSMKYMAPPTDTAIPVGAVVLESTLTKEIGLKLSDNSDDFEAPVETINQTSDILSKIKKEVIVREGMTVDDGLLDHIRPYPEEIHDLNSRILANIDVFKESEELNQVTKQLLLFSEEVHPETYQEVTEYFLTNFSRDDDFIAAETRDPTSGKGLAYVVEAVLAYSKRIEIPKRSRDVLSRFVNRTPKLRDSADCAITKAVQSVKWKNYKLETYDNNLPKGPIKLLVNISGPFVHLMFKSQSKNALADDDELIKEIKYCLEAIGRKLRIYINRKASFHQTQKRASKIDRYIPLFVKSVYNIALQGGKYQDKVKEKELELLMREAIGKRAPDAIIQETAPEPIKIEKPSVDIMETEEDISKEGIVSEIPIEKVESKIESIPPKREILDKKVDLENVDNWTVAKLRSYCRENNITITSKIKKIDMIKKIREAQGLEKPIPEKKELIQKKIEPVAPGTIREKRELIKISKGKAPSTPTPKDIPIRIKPPPPELKQTQLPIITTEKIMKSLSDNWQTIKELIWKMKIKDMMDARFLQIKLKELERKGQVSVDVKKGKKYWKLP